jgi:hypothetical protein
MASFDLWTPEFCLGCDKQTDGAAYCSESCKLADFEKTSSSASTPSSSSPSSPSLLTAPSYPWTSQSSSSNKFYLSPAYDFHAHSPAHRNTFSSRTDSSLTPSSSYSSLCSMQTAASAQQQQQQQQQAVETVQLSERARKELREYAISFEYARLQRRRSY